MKSYSNRGYPTRRIRVALALFTVLLAAMACAQPIPGADSTPTPCPSNCPPPNRGAHAEHTLSLAHFRFSYFDPFTVQSSDSSSAQLGASSNLGDVTVLFESVGVSNGTTSAQLLSRVEQQELTPDQFSGIQDQGPINGAEIGYVSGAGQSFAAATNQTNAPQELVYLEFMAATRGTVGVVFIAASPLDPNSPDTKVVPNANYDQMVNSVVWT